MINLVLTDFIKIADAILSSMPVAGMLHVSTFEETALLLCDFPLTLNFEKSQILLNF